MNCQTCGEGVDATQRFCDTCGTAVAKQDRPAVGTAVQPAGDSAVPATLGAWPATTPELSAPGILGQAMPAEVPVETLPGSPIRLGNDEVIWRQYRVLRLRRLARGEGVLYVTDSRLVFYAHSTGFMFQRPSVLVQQTSLAEVSGVETYVTRRFSLALLGVSALLPRPSRPRAY